MKSLIAVFLVSLLLLGGCDMCKNKNNNTTTDRISIVNDISFCHDFYVEQNKVYYRCEVTIENSHNSEKVIKLTGFRPRDVDVGLILNQELYLTDESGNPCDISLPPNSTKRYEVYFVGDHAGGFTKADRLMPIIEITEIG